MSVGIHVASFLRAKGHFFPLVFNEYQRFFFSLLVHAAKIKPTASGDYSSPIQQDICIKRETKVKGRKPPAKTDTTNFYLGIIFQIYLIK